MFLGMIEGRAEDLGTSFPKVISEVNPKQLWNAFRQMKTDGMMHKR